jgi:ABC-2 type transport system ATP-binding protein
MILTLTLPLPLSLLPLGDYDSGVIACEYAGALLLGASATALGLLLSSLSKNQAGSFLGSAVVLMAVMLVNQIIEIRSLIKELGRRKTVILSTHILQEVEAVCSRVLILNEGRIAAQGRPEEIAETMKGGDTWELCLKGADPGSVGEKLSRLGIDPASARTEAGEEGTVKAGFFIQGGSSGLLEGERIFDWAVSEGLKILSMNRKKLSLEDIFVQLTAEERGSQPLTAEGDQHTTSEESK